MLLYQEIGKLEDLVPELAFKAAALAETAVYSPLGTHARDAFPPHVYSLLVYAHKLLSVPHSVYLELVAAVLCKGDGFFNAYPFAQEICQVGLGKVYVAGVVFRAANVDYLELLGAV